MSWGVDDLEVRFGARVAVSGVTLVAVPGEVTAIVGGDGAGKSTVLRAMVGLAAPSRGVVRRPSPDRVGYVSAGPGVYLDLTVDENLDFVASSYRLPAPVARQRIAELVNRTKLTEARDRLAGDLSGGMRRKLAFAMALLPGPQLLVMDEPTTGVDPVSRTELWQLISKAASAGAAVLFATTYLDEAERAAYVVALDEGSPLLTGSPEELVRLVAGIVVDGVPLETDRPRAWRRGDRWRIWRPAGQPVEGDLRVSPDLEDAVIVAALAKHLGHEPVGGSAL